MQIIDDFKMSLSWLTPSRMARSVPPDARAAYDASYLRIARKTDAMFAWLFALQWALAIAFALWQAPFGWDGDARYVHFHVYLAFILGGALAWFPIYLNVSKPGRPLNRFAAAFAQSGFTILLIHLSGGRIETHFHIFGSLAFLAFYRDARVVAVATGLTAAHHFLQGAFWPESIYGVLAATPWRAFEHSAWVIFEDVFLFASIRVGLQELAKIAAKQAALQLALDGTEANVRARTADLQKSQETVVAQHAALLESSRLSALGELAAGVAHEINNPVAVIKTTSSQLAELLRERDVDFDAMATMADAIEKTTDRIGGIASGLKAFATTSKAPIERVSVAMIVDQAVASCSARLRGQGIRLTAVGSPVDCRVRGQATDLIQALVCLLDNAAEAVEDLPYKWIEVEVAVVDASVEISVRDSGWGLSEDVRSKAFKPFFTTKPIGAGLGLGLCLSLGIAKSHGGDLFVDAHSPRTRFVIRLPVDAAPIQAEAA